MSDINVQKERLRIIKLLTEGCTKSGLSRLAITYLDYIEKLENERKRISVVSSSPSGTKF